MQPRRPQGHCAPPRRTTTCPISPAAPRPTHGRPSSTMPPPTPVPQNTPSTEANWRAAPSWNAASVATCTSLPSFTAVPSRPPRSLPSAKVPSQPGRLRALETVPSSSSTAPGEPTPTPLSWAVPVPASCAAVRSAPAIASETSAGPPSVGVGTRACARTFESSSTTTAWIFVPPRSMPPRTSGLRRAGVLAPIDDVRRGDGASVRGGRRRVGVDAHVADAVVVVDPALVPPHRSLHARVPARSQRPVSGADPGGLVLALLLDDARLQHGDRLRRRESGELRVRLVERAAQRLPVEAREDAAVGRHADPVHVVVARVVGGQVVPRLVRRGADVGVEREAHVLGPLCPEHVDDVAVGRLVRLRATALPAGE